MSLQTSVVMSVASLVAGILHASSTLAQAAYTGASGSEAIARGAETATSSGAESGGGLVEITVTAQKREQSLRDVGLMVTTAMGEELVQLGISSPGDLAKITPGLTFTRSQDGTPLYTLRGVGFNDYTLGASPAVSVYVDQVPLAYSAFTQGVNLDVERVEVLKGPQGILFGQNSTGGAINYIARKPTREPEAGISLSVGRFETLETEAYLNGALGSTLSARLAAGATTSEPWQKSVTRGDELGRQRSYRGRLQLLWEPTERLQMLFGANGWRDKSDTQAGQLIGLMLQIPDGSESPNPDEVNRRIAAFESYPLAPRDARAADWDDGRSLERDDDFYQVSLRADYAIGDAVTLTSITAYSEYREDYALDRDGVSLRNAGVTADGEVQSVSQELRLAGSTYRLQWMIGGNYATNDVISANDILTGDSTNTAILPGGPFIARSTTTITQDIKETAFFGNVEVLLTETLTLLGGARYTKSENDYTSCMVGDLGMQQTFTFLADLLSGTPDAPADATTCLNLDATTLDLIRTPFQDSLDEDNVSWRVGLNYKPSQDVLIYGLASRGFKSGSFPTVPASTTAQFTPVTQESVLAYEVGTKLTLLDNTLQVNAAVFHYRYDDKQVRGIILDPVFNQLEQLVNIPRSTIRGAEIELTSRPVDGLTLRAGATYVDSEVKAFTGINNSREFGDFRGSALPFSPKWHVVADIDYRWSLSGRLGAFVGSNLLYNSESSSTVGDPPSSRIKAFTTIDVRAGVMAADERWSLTFWGRNVTDEYYWTNQFVTQDVITRYVAKPVTYGATFSWRF